VETPLFTLQNSKNEKIQQKKKKEKGRATETRGLFWKFLQWFPDLNNGYLKLF
jgi:hypothetical protein